MFEGSLGAPIGATAFSFATCSGAVYHMYLQNLCLRFGATAL